MRIQILDTGSDQVEYSKSVFSQKKKKGLALDVNFRGEATLDIGPFYLWQRGISED